MAIKFLLDPEKALEAILYVVSRAETDKYGTLKILYVADKRHLERYGRFIFGDYYHALENGPTPMNAYDIIQYAAGAKGESVIPSARDALRVGSADNPHALHALRDPDLDVLSESDIECLDEVINALDGTDPKRKFAELWNDVHDDAWSAAWKTKPNKRMEVDEIVHQFEGAEDLIEYLQGA